MEIPTLSSLHRKLLLLYASLFVMTSSGGTNLYSRISGNWSSASSWLKMDGSLSSAAPTSSDNVYIQNGNTITVDVNSVCNNLTIAAPSSDGYSVLFIGTKTLTVNNTLELNEGTTPSSLRVAQINISNGTLNIGDDLIFNTSNAASAVLNSTGSASINITGDARYTNVNGTFNRGSSTVNYNGGNQSVLGFTYYTLKISNGGVKSLLDDATIESSGSLILSDGALALSKHTLTIDNISSSAISRTSGYIQSEDVSLTGSNANNNAKLTWQIKNDGNPHIFPFGTSTGNYIPVTVDPPNSGNMKYVTVSTYKASANNTPYPVGVTHVNDLTGKNNSKNTVDRFWYISTTSSNANASVSFTYDQSERPENGESGSDNMGTRAQLWNGPSNKWNSEIAGQTYDTLTNKVTVPIPNSSFSTGSVWTLALHVSPLPVELISFTAKNETGSNILKWSTATESNSSHFEVDRSTNGLIFYAIGEVQSKGNSTTVQNYQYVDQTPAVKSSGTLYYRLKQVNEDGTYKYTNCVSVDNKNVILGTVYPSPTKDILNYKLNIKEEGNFTVEILDDMGMLCMKETKETSPYRDEFQSNLETLKKGIYFLKVSSPTGAVFFRKFEKTN